MEPTSLQVRYYGDPCLIQASSSITEVGVSERLLIQSMIHTMYAYKGIGLAAPQVGINKRLFVVDIGDGPMAFINPKVIEQSGVAVMEEGCLSIPGVMVDIERPATILVEYIDENNQKQQQAFNELMARVFQHESDHLDGRLILDYVDDRVRAKLVESFEKAMKENKNL